MSSGKRSTINFSERKWNTTKCTIRILRNIVKSVDVVLAEAIKLVMVFKKVMLFHLTNSKTNSPKLNSILTTMKKKMKDLARKASQLKKIKKLKKMMTNNENKLKKNSKSKLRKKKHNAKRRRKNAWQLKRKLSKRNKRKKRKRNKKDYVNKRKLRKT